jgi:hypothetical protein
MSQQQPAPKNIFSNIGNAIVNILIAPFKMFARFLAGYTTARDFFWWCAGVHRPSIKTAETDHAKYVGMGFTVFITGILACLSGGFAMSSMTDSTFWVVVFAIIWGSMIFNFDRFIVTSMREKNFLAFLPRFVMATVIALTMSKPMEIWIFKSQIDFQIKKDTEQNRTDMTVELKKSLNINDLEQEVKNKEIRKDSISDRKENAPTEIATVKTTSDRFDQVSQSNKKVLEINLAQISSLTKDLEKKRASGRYHIDVYDKDNKRWRKKSTPEWKRIEADINTKIAALNKINNNLVQDATRLQAEMIRVSQEVSIDKGREVLSLSQDVDTTKKQLANAKAKYERKMQEYNEYIDQSGKGFVGQLSALHTLSAENNSMWLISNFIMLLFWVIETAPIFAKLVLPKTAYDEEIEEFEKTLKIKLDERIDRRLQLKNSNLATQQIDIDKAENTKQAEFDQQKSENDAKLAQQKKTAEQAQEDKQKAEAEAAQRQRDAAAESDKVKYEAELKKQAKIARLNLLRETQAATTEIRELEKALGDELTRYQINEAEKAKMKESEINTSEAIIKKVAAAQIEIANHIIEEWKKQELEKLKKNGIMSNIKTKEED